MTRQCLGKRRIGEIETLRSDARIKLKSVYPKNKL
jgi:hypothetical protein